MRSQDNVNSFGARRKLEGMPGEVYGYQLARLADAGVIKNLDLLPFSIKVLLESVVREENGKTVTRDDVAALAGYDPKRPGVIQVPFMAARVLLQDFTGVPCVVDLAAMRSAMARMGLDPARINPQIPVDLVVDHSVQVDVFALPEAFRRNTELEFQRNRERYEFLHWGEHALENFSAVPPGSGICHQVNLEHLARVVQTRDVGGVTLAFPDSVLGTDSHTPMVNGISVLGWGVGGIEAEAVMLGQPLFMLAPSVIGFKVKGRLPEGATATDLVLTITQMLRKKGVVGKFVEFFGSGLSSMTVPDRATISNMAPEYGATVGYFPADEQTLAYMRATGRPDDLVALTERYCKAQGLFRTDETPDPEFEDVLELDLGTVKPSLAGPKRPQDRVELNEMKTVWHRTLKAPLEERGFALQDKRSGPEVKVDMGDGRTGEMTHGSVAIAAITSCTNTSNPSVMLAAGILAKKAVEKGLQVKPFVKTSLAPGSMVVTDYLTEAGLLPYLEKLGFHVVGYGCTTCIGNSGPLPQPVADAIKAGDLVAASVLSGNRNFEGRINPLTRANYLASPPLVVAYALAGTVDWDPKDDPIGVGSDGKPVYLSDIWPTGEEISAFLSKALDPEKFRRRYGEIRTVNEEWNAIKSTGSSVFKWSEDSTYVQEPPFFQDMEAEPGKILPIQSAHVLVIAGDSLTTDHISPAGAIPDDGPAGRFLVGRGVKPSDFNSFGSRRGNHDVMVRGTFANIRLRNRMAPGTEGGFTTHVPTGEVTTIYDAAQRYIKDKTPAIVLGGKDYGMGSSRDWAAKGTLLLGVKAVIAQSFERIHRSNLLGMGVLPLQFTDGESVESLGLTGREQYTINIDDDLAPGQKITVQATNLNGNKKEFTVVCRLDSPVEVEYYRNGGILTTVLRAFMKE